MSETAKDWLRLNALEHLVEAFDHHKISVDLFSDLTEADLADLGLTIGDRIVFHRALRQDARFDVSAESRTENQANTGRMPERRFLTIAFIDLVGSTPLSLQIDAEEMHEVLRTYLGTVADITHSFGGHVVKYLGDGVMSVFGWPVAYEDQTERAVLMTLEAVRAVQALTTLPGLSLDVRAGIASGAVVAGDIGDEVNDITGPAANLAQRLQSHAKPGEIVIDATTRNTLPSEIRLASLGTLTLKGFSESVDAFRVDSAPVFARKRAPFMLSGNPIFGRDDEIATLNKFWSDARKGRGRTVVIEGEPGIGKTRLMSEFLRQSDKSPLIPLSLQCLEYRSVSAMYPLRQELKRSAGFRRDDNAASRREKLSLFIAKRCKKPQLASALFATLLSIADEDEEAYVNEHVPDRVRLALDLFIELTLKAAANTPLVVILEDAHWADPSTINYCRMLWERITDRKILMIIATRPEWTPPEGAFSDADLIRLTKLGRDDSRRVIEQTVGAHLSPTVFEAILQRAEDVPLYLEELARVVVDSSTGDDLPASIQSSMLARIDRLEADRPIIQFLAVLGLTFSLGSILENSNYDRPVIAAALARLVNAGMLVRDERSDQIRYQFRHALIQEAAYASVLRRTKIELHHQIADKLLYRLREKKIADPEVLARHLSLAERPAEAIPFWQSTGDRLAGQSAHTEAAQHYESGLADVAKLPAGSVRDEHEYALRVRLSAALLTVEGWSAPRVAQNYEAALVLSNRLGDPKKQFVAIRGRFNVLLLRGELSAARKLVDELKHVARLSSDPVLLAEALKTDGGCAVHEANFQHAAECLKESIGISMVSSDREQAVVFGTDLVVIALAHLAWAQWFLGAPELADQHIAEALDVARSDQHVFSETYAEGFASCLHQFGADAERALRHADNVVSFSEKYHFHYFEGWGRILRGWSMTILGDAEQGLGELDRGISIYRRTGAELILPYAFALRSEAREIASADGSIALRTESKSEFNNTVSESRFYRLPRSYRWSGDSVVIAKSK